VIGGGLQRQSWTALARPWRDRARGPESGTTSGKQVPLAVALSKEPSEGPKAFGGTGGGQAAKGCVNFPRSTPSSVEASWSMPWITSLSGNSERTECVPIPKPNISTPARRR
jgi:hypothetical protein